MDIDCHACDIAFRGAVVDDDVPDENSYTDFGGHHSRPGWWSPFTRKPRNLYNTGQAVCGSRGCTRACMISMESRGVVSNRFHKPFRRRKPWQVDWSAPPPPANGPTGNADSESDSD
jgi:hypothetical protein